MKLYDSGVYLVNGKEIMTDAAEVQQKTGKAVTKEQAAENTIAYGILKKHNTSGNMDKLQVRFDKLTSHDITFVGIIQTARASGLERFPMPYVLTNCHNSLCAVKSGVIYQSGEPGCRSDNGRTPCGRLRGLPRKFTGNTV